MTWEKSFTAYTDELTSITATNYSETDSLSLSVSIIANQSILIDSYLDISGKPDWVHAEEILE